MSTQELIFSCDGLVVTLNEAGLPERVEHDHRPGRSLLQPQREPGSVIIGGRRSRWEPAGLVTDVDEAEVRYVIADQPQIEYVIRNSFAGRWLQRHMLLNTSSSPLVIDDLELPVVPAPGCIGWAQTTAGETSWTVQPADGSGPLLAGDLVQGAISARSSDGFRSGEILLPAGRRFVLQWRISAARNAVEVITGRQSQLSPWTELPVGVPYEIEDPDTAVVAGEPIEAQQEGAVQVVHCDRPGRYPIELRSARGTSRLDLVWVPPLEELIIELSDAWLTGRRSGAGVGVLPGGGAALGLQQAVISRLTDSADEAEDALALHTARLLERDRLSIMDLAFLSQEAVRTGDQDPLQHSRSALLDLTAPQPGLGLAATRMCLAELALGGSPAMIISHLREVAAGRWADPDQPSEIVGLADDDHLLRHASLLELITVIGPAGGDRRRARIGNGGGAGPAPEVLAVGAELGSGLPGHRLGPPRPAASVYAAAVLDLLPDDQGVELERWWGATPHTVAERTRTTALAAALWPPPIDPGETAGEPDRPADVAARANDTEIADVIGWLVLGQPIV